MSKHLFNFGKAEQIYASEACILPNMSKVYSRKYRVPLIYRWEPKTVRRVNLWSSVLITPMPFYKSFLPSNNIVIASLCLLCVVLVIIRHLAWALDIAQHEGYTEFNFKQCFTFPFPFGAVFAIIVSNCLVIWLIETFPILIIMSVTNCIITATMYSCVKNYA